MKLSYFLGKSFSYISGNGTFLPLPQNIFHKKPTLKIFLIFQKVELSSPKIKKFLIFSQKGFSYISGNGTFLKNFLYFWRKLSKCKKKKTI